MAVLQTCNCGGRARRHRGPIVPLFLGLADDRLTKNFEVTRGVLLQLITRAVVASDEILPRLEVEAERSIMPGAGRGYYPGLRCSGRGSSRVA